LPARFFCSRLPFDSTAFYYATGCAVHTLYLCWLRFPTPVCLPCHAATTATVPLGCYLSLRTCGRLPTPFYRTYVSAFCCYTVCRYVWFPTPRLYCVLVYTGLPHSGFTIAVLTFVYIVTVWTRRTLRLLDVPQFPAYVLPFWFTAHLPPYLAFYGSLCSILNTPTTHPLRFAFTWVRVCRTLRFGCRLRLDLP